VLIAEGKTEVRTAEGKLEKSAKSEQASATALDKKVEKMEEKLRVKLIKAKREEQTGMESEATAKQDVKQASELRIKAQNLKDKSEAARKAFVKQEHPVEMATQLAAHDHKEYRKAELAVAKEVAVLSEHPESVKIRAKVDKLVAKSKNDKSKMAEDAQLLKKLEGRTASAKFGGSHGFAHLKEESVKIAKKAELIADKAVTLAKEGHVMKKKANKLIHEVQKEQRKPDQLHKQAEAERAKYDQHLKEVTKLKGAMHKLKVQERKEQSSQLKAKDKSYSSMRSELEREAGEKPESHSKQDELQAKDSYDQLEEAEEKKEKAKLKQEREARLIDKNHHSSSSSGGMGDQLQAAMKRAHILSAKRSTFLSGLFSNKAPWDTKTSI